MAVDVREKLVELVAQKVCDTWSEACDEWMPHDCGKCYANDCHIAEVADHLIAHGVTVQEWISVKDKLPGYGQEVVVYGGNYLKSCVTTMRFWDSSCVDWFGVTHWQPLPQPPKGE